MRENTVKMNSPITFTTDEQQLSCYVMKIFDSDVDSVWKHFTNAELLDLWWAPKPWKCETKKFDFRDGGIWNFVMKSPENEKFFSGVNYHEINHHRSISMADFATDENGNVQPNVPTVNWLIGFTGIEQGTKLTLNLFFNSIEDLKQILEMGFEDGLKMQLNQLEEVLR